MDVLSYGFALVVFSGGFMGYMKAGMISVKSTPACINNYGLGPVLDIKLL